MIDLIKFDVNNDFFQTTQLKLKKKMRDENISI